MTIPVFHDASDVALSPGAAAFDALVRERMRQPFEWGVNDCCLFAADCVQALTGVDVAADVRGTYTDAIAAGRLIASLGGIAALGSRAGQPVPPLCAQAGDIGLIMCGDRELLAVCMGPIWIGPAAEGLLNMPFESAVMAWRVCNG